MLIRGLCKLEPRERLGNKKGGVREIRKHRWFQGFDWQALRACKLESPFDPDIKGPLDTKHFPITSTEQMDGDPIEERKILSTANMSWDSQF